MSTRHRTPLAAVIIMLLMFSVAASAMAGSPRSDTTGTEAGVTTEYALVQLHGDPLATNEKIRPAPGKKIDFNANTVKSHRAQLAKLRNDFKAWLRTNAPKAQVTGEFDLALNAVSIKLNGTSLDTIRASSLVKSAAYEGLYYPTDEDSDLKIIDAVDAWSSAGGSATAGEGVKVAVVDSGIDEDHSCFDDDAYPDQPKLGDPKFTNNKVIVARVFYNKAAAQGLTAEAVGSHGTHVAGTIACNFETSITVEAAEGVDIPYEMSGVAPRALLGNYNVFPGTVESARSEDILNALEAAYADGMDIANMSLGGGASGIHDLLTIAVDNLDIANMVVAVSAGNSGPGHYTVGSPGSAARALTAGASTVPHFVGAPVTINNVVYGGASGDFETVSADVTAQLGVVSGSTNGLDTACTALPRGSLTGKIALISRGVCTFSTKIRNAQNAGAVAVLVANNVAGDPTAMGSDGTADQPIVPAYMVALSTGLALVGLNGATATIGASLDYIPTPNVDIMAGFSSQGPTDVDFRVKPDVVAPGVNVLSSVVGGKFAFYQGTSMAAPHLAGSAAIVLQQHRDWSAAQVRSAIVNTAERGVLTAYTNGTTPVEDVNIQGSGRENLLAAVNAQVAVDPVSVTFGAVPSGAGQSLQVAVTLTNLTGSGATYTVAVDDAVAAVDFSASQSSVAVAPGESATITITMTAEKQAGQGDYQAWLNITSGGTEIAHAALYTHVK